MDFTKNTNLSIEEISENKTSGNELSVTKTSDSTAEKTFTNNAFSSGYVNSFLDSFIYFNK